MINILFTANGELTPPPEDQLVNFDAAGGIIDEAMEKARKEGVDPFVFLTVLHAAMLDLTHQISADEYYSTLVNDPAGQLKTHREILKLTAMESKNAQ